MTMFAPAPGKEKVCVMKGIGDCSGAIGYGICEEHSRLIFQIAMR
jgi:hypothetical protein